MKISKLLLIPALVLAVSAKEPKNKQESGIVSSETQKLMISAGVGALAGYIVNSVADIQDQNTKIMMVTAVSAAAGLKTKEYLDKKDK